MSCHGNVPAVKMQCKTTIHSLPKISLATHDGENCGSRNCRRIWNVWYTQSTRCTNLSFTPFDTSNVIVLLMKFEWGNIHKNTHRRFKGDIYNQMTVQETNLRKKCWVMSSGDPLDVNDDVIPGHAEIVTCDILAVFPCIRFIWTGVYVWN